MAGVFRREALAEVQLPEVAATGRAGDLRAFVDDAPLLLAGERAGSCPENGGGKEHCLHFDKESSNPDGELPAIECRTCIETCPNQLHKESTKSCEEARKSLKNGRNKSSGAGTSFAIIVSSRN